MNEQKEIKTDLEIKLQERQGVLDILCDFIRIAIGNNMHVITSKKGNMMETMLYRITMTSLLINCLMAAVLVYLAG